MKNNIIFILSVFITLTSFSPDCNTRMTKSELIARQGIVAIMPPDFDFDYQWKVQSYEWLFKTQNELYTGTATSGVYPPALQSLLKSANTNDILIIEKVFVVGSDGERRKVGGLTIVVK